MKRLFLKRSDIIHYDEVFRPNTLVDWMPAPCTGNSEKFGWIDIEVISAKTGNIARRIQGRTVEIENVSPLFIKITTEKRLRTRERVYINGEEYEAIPIARERHTNYLIYSFKKKINRQ